MPANDIDRRTVLRAAGATAAAGVGAAGIAAAGDGASTFGPGDCVVTNSKAEAYDECPPGYHVWDVEEDTPGTVQETCTDKYGNEWVTVYFNCIDETWTVDKDDLTYGQICYC
jgi:hypothetical protein